MFILFILFLGLAVGSFLNAVIYRLQKNESIVFDRSHCPDCKVTLCWIDLVPLMSFVWLRGICRYCGKKISWQYPIVELATALAFVWVYWWRFPQLFDPIFSMVSPDLLTLEFFKLLYYLTITGLLILIFLYDLKTYLILDKVIFSSIALSFLVLVWRSIEYGNINIFWLGLLSALIGSGFFLTLVLVSKGKWMGMGDVKLAIFMGLILGWPHILIALFIAFMVGAIVGLFLIALKKKGLKSEVPFGPFLAGATFLVMIYGNYLTNLLGGFMLW